jgi:hypothetical protein
VTKRIWGSFDDYITPSGGANCVGRNMANNYFFVLCLVIKDLGVACKNHPEKLLLNLVTPLHKQTRRKYIDRMTDDKVHCMVKAKEYKFDYWDGDRRYCYGGYRYIDDRWKKVAQSLIDIYNLKHNAKILDVGCGKALLIYELKQLLPDAEVIGFDISRHGLGDAYEEICDYFGPVSCSGSVSQG